MTLGNKPLLHLLALFVGCFTLSCQKETGLSRPYPRIATLPAAHIDTTGVSFSGEFVYVDPLFEADALGFIWSKDSSALIETAERVELTAADSGFKYRCTAALDSGAIYYVRAFIRGGGYTVYGSPQGFVSKGGLGCRIDTVMPGNWTWGDSLIIFGRNFSYHSERNRVWLNQTLVTPDTCTDKLLQLNIDNILSDNSIRITIESNGSIFTYSPVLQRSNALVETIRPYAASVGDTVTLSGKGFHPVTPGLNQVFVGTRQATLSFCSNDTLLFVVPDGLTWGINTLRVVVNNVPSVGIDEILIPEP